MFDESFIYEFWIVTQGFETAGLVNKLLLQCIYCSEYFHLVSFFDIEVICYDYY